MLQGREPTEILCFNTTFRAKVNRYTGELTKDLADPSRILSREHWNADIDLKTSNSLVHMVWMVDIAMLYHTFVERCS